MYAFKGDILQFCYTDDSDLAQEETRYSFGICNKDLEDQLDSVRIDIKKNPYNDNRTYISRNFERFNVVISNYDDHETSIISPEEMDEEYNNRPYSSLVRIEDD